MYILVKSGWWCGNHGGRLYIPRVNPVLINVPCICIMAHGAEKIFML